MAGDYTDPRVDRLAEYLGRQFSEIVADVHASGYLRGKSETSAAVLGAVAEIRSKVAEVREAIVGPDVDKEADGGLFAKLLIGDTTTTIGTHGVTEADEETVVDILSDAIRRAFSEARGAEE